jgi:hypothetical protein
MHRGAVEIGASYTLDIPFNHTTGDYLAAVHPLKSQENISMRLQKIPQYLFEGKHHVSSSKTKTNTI